MRIATTQFHATMNTALQNANARLEHVMQQMSTGQRLLLPSDDPISNVRLSRMAREDAALTQYRDNISALSTRLMQNETALGSMVQDMLQVRDLLVWARDGSNTSEDVNAMASSLTALRDSLFYSSNSKRSGRPLPVLRHGQRNGHGHLRRYPAPGLALYLHRQHRAAAGRRGPRHHPDGQCHAV